MSKVTQKGGQNWAAKSWLQQPCLPFPQPPLFMLDHRAGISNARLGLKALEPGVGALGWALSPPHAGEAKMEKLQPFRVPEPGAEHRLPPERPAKLPRVPQPDSCASLGHRGWESLWIDH